MKVNEHTLTKALLERLRFGLPRSFMIDKLNDRLTAALQDIVISGNQVTSWWEVKHAKPKIIGTELQLVQAKRRELAGFCRYIVYQESGIHRTTGIVRPRDIGANGFFPFEQSVDHEADHQFILNYVSIVHGVMNA